MFATSKIFGLSKFLYEDESSCLLFSRDPSLWASSKERTYNVKTAFDSNKILEFMCSILGIKIEEINRER